MSDNSEALPEHHDISNIPTIPLESNVKDQLAIDDSILISERSMVKVTDKRGDNGVSAEQEINQVLKDEIEKINASLAKIS